MATSSVETETASIPATSTRLAAEVFGTFVLVFGVIGSAIFSANFNADSNGSGLLGVALAVGLAVLVAAYTVGGISGGHFNPAVTIGLAFAKRFAWKDVAGYVVAQIIGGALATTLIFVIAAGGAEGFLAGAQKGGFASNGYGEASPEGFGLVSVLIAEVVLTAFLVFVILGVTEKTATAGFAPLAIGISLIVIHLVAIPISNASVNPARSIATAIFGGTTAQSQLWAFIVAPIIGGVIAGLTYGPFFRRFKK